jgi:hypothetical protein
MMHGGASTKPSAAGNTHSSPTGTPKPSERRKAWNSLIVEEPSGKIGCAAGDWSCRIAENIASVKDLPKCGGKGCREKGYKPQPYLYDYITTNAVDSDKDYSAKEVMDVFKRNPDTIFPFKIQGCLEFSAGSECTLQTGQSNASDYIPVPYDSLGLVGVDTTPTSVTFTVLDTQYFDDPAPRSPSPPSRQMVRFG